MKTKHLIFPALALLPAALLILSACSSSTSIPGEHTSMIGTTATSTTFVDTLKVTAKVAAIDEAKREVKLTLANGKSITVKCGPEVANFNQIRVNDRVTVNATEELSIYLDKGRAMGFSGHGGGALAPIGAKPGGAVADTVRETVKIAAINTKKRTVTFRDQYGILETAAVGEHIDLSKAKVGDSVTISHTEALAVSVEKS